MNQLSYNDSEAILDEIALTNLVEALTIKQRAVVALKHAGFNFGDIGKILGMTRQAAGSVFSRASEKLKTHLENGAL